MKLLRLLGALMCALLFVQLAFAQAAAPVISPAPGSYASTQSVTVSDSTSGADIFCTTDGSTPTPESPKYTGPITLTSSTTFQCIAAVAGVRQNNIQNSNPNAPGSLWKAVDCVNGGGSGTPTGLVHSNGIASPSLSGASMEFSMTAHGSQTNCLWSTNTSIGHCDNCTYQMYDYQLYLDAGICTNKGTTEQDDAKVAPSLGNLRFMAGAQWRRNGCTSGHACLDIAGNSNVSWTFTGVDIPLACSTYHHMQRAEHFVPSEVTSKPCVDRNGAHWPYVYQDYWIVDGTKYNNGGAGWKYCANSVNWPSWEWPQHQEDATNGTHTMYLDQANWVAYLPGSTVSSNAFTITGGTGTPTAATPSITPGGGFYTTSQTVTMTDATPGTVIHYTTDGSNPTSSSSTYSSALTVSTTTTVKAIAIASGYNNSAVASAVYSFSSSGGLTATPIFSPNGGSFTSSQIVSLSDATSGAVIYFTTDGTTPTTSSNVYSIPLNVTATTTIKAMAVAAGLTNSSVATATYTITSTLIAATPSFSPAAGIFTGTQTVTLADTTPSSAIHYTTDGSTPTGSSTTYSTALTVSTTTTVKAIAIASGFTNSAVGSATYTIGCGQTPYATGNIDPTQIKPGGRLGTGLFVQMAGGTFTTNDLAVYDCNGNAIDSGVLLSALATKSAVQQESYISGTDTGTANAYAVTLSPAPTIGLNSIVTFKAANANTGASTIAVNGGSATAIKKQVSVALASGDVLAGQIVTLKYDGTNWQMAIPSSSGGSSPLTTKGDLYGFDTANNRIPVGSNGKVMTADSTNALGVSWQTSSSGFTNPMTTLGDLIGAATGGTPTRLPVGSDGQVVTADHTQTTGMKWATPSGGGGAVVLLEAHTASSSAELDFTTSITSTYDEYVVEVLNLVPATNATDLFLQFSTNGGSSYDATSGHYSWAAFRWIAGANSQNGSASATSIGLTTGASLTSNTVSNAGIVGTYKIFNPLSGTMHTLLAGNGNSWYSAGPDMGTSISGTYLQTTAVNAFRIFFGSGNIASGTVRVYGIAH